MAERNRALKEQVKTLRSEGASYTMISRTIGVAKSTLHYWLVGTPPSRFQRDPEFRLKRLAENRKIAAATLRAQNVARVELIRERVQQEMKDLPLENVMVQKALAAMLYRAEGSKTSAFKFANTDPALSLLFVTLLRNAFKLDEGKIRIKLYVHWYHRIRKVRKFWSDLLKVPESQFEKVYIKPRSKTKRMRKNFVGICFIKYGVGAQALKNELMIVAHSVQEKIVDYAPVVQPG